MTDRHLLRILTFLARGAARCEPAGKPGTSLLQGGDRGTIAVPGEAIGQAIARGLIIDAEGDISIAQAGFAWMARAGSGEDRFQAQHQDRDIRAVELAGAREFVMVNLKESPLAALAQRKGRDGRAFLSAFEIEAGERLRADYDFGQLMPRMSANWEAAVSAGRRGGGNTKADLSDNALAARQRVNAAIEAVGPELSGVLVDVCCFLKGLEEVETERRWPRRSAKLMLKTALGVLDRHYRPKQRGDGRRSVVHWGAPDYRPRVGE
ncbi:hypothetical protein GTW25_00590 [Aliihoeflea aestuarii]|jgi:hypothetical protein|uniref:DUF6456 domain-containing protein n=1 Tax=Aliihoeflea aestuarii TaxID=453840 RepID=UPI00209303E6|nr:DUF6456 domain-containing protein [Aliihoeflea aestuarii]MCO6389527.1 hypothetical protein [Aliihoeflea aestuarii]